MSKEINHETYSLRLLTPADVPSCITLFNSYLGKGFFSQEELSQYIIEPNRYAAGIFDAEGNLASAITGAVVNNEELNKFIPEDFRLRISHLIGANENKNIGILKSMATHAQYQKQGLGGRLVNDLTDWLKSSEVTKIVAFGWEDDAGCHVENVLTHAEYSKLAKFSSFWRKDSIEHNYHCPSCGNPCECSVVVFIKELNIESPTNSSHIIF